MKIVLMVLAVVGLCGIVGPYCQRLALTINPEARIGEMHIGLSVQVVSAILLAVCVGFIAMLERHDNGNRH